MTRIMSINTRRYVVIVPIVCLIALCILFVVAHRLPTSANPLGVYLRYPRMQLEAKGRCQNNNFPMPEFSSYCVIERNGGFITFSYDDAQMLRNVCFWNTPTVRLGDIVAWYGIYDSSARDADQYRYTFSREGLQIVAVTAEDSLDALVSYSIFSIREHFEPVDIDALPVCQ